MDTRPTFERNGTLHIVIGALIAIAGVFALTGSVAATFAVLLFAGGVWMLVYGMKLRQRFTSPREPARQDPS